MLGCGEEWNIGQATTSSVFFIVAVQKGVVPVVDVFRHLTPPLNKTRMSLQDCTVRDVRK